MLWLDPNYSEPVDNAESFNAPSYPFRFSYALEFLAQILAYMLDSLVRVSRRVVLYRFTNNSDKGGNTSPHKSGPNAARADGKTPPYGPMPPYRC